MAVTSWFMLPAGLRNLYWNAGKLSLLACILILDVQSVCQIWIGYFGRNSWTCPALFCCLWPCYCFGPMMPFCAFMRNISKLRWITNTQGWCQGKLLGGGGETKQPQGSRGQSPLVGVRGLKIHCVISSYFMNAFLWEGYKFLNTL